jgi:hypothetical protein
MHEPHTKPKMKTHRQLADLLRSEIGRAERHGLPVITITTARARTLLADLADAETKPYSAPKFFAHLDRVLA